MDLMAVNKGNLDASISQLILKDGKQSFTLKNIVSLPVSIAAGASLKIAEVDFSPLISSNWLDNVGYDVVEDLAGTIYTPVVKAISDSPDQVIDGEEGVLRISPNPAYDYLTIESRQESAFGIRTTLYDVNGSIVGSGTSTSSVVQMPLGSIESGLYLCKVECANQIWTTRVFVVR
jgi:hypothetical protein